VELAEELSLVSRSMTDIKDSDDSLGLLPVINPMASYRKASQALTDF
jgi:hypothetical protein